MVFAFNLMPRQSRGRLGIHADPRGGTISVQVLRAEHLAKADPLGLSGAYCEGGCGRYAESRNSWSCLRSVRME